MISTSTTDTFRGLRVHELAAIVRLAQATGAISMMKQVNVVENLGKAPDLVLAEHMIRAVHMLSGEPVE
jgi:hypothetical protein